MAFAPFPIEGKSSVRAVRDFKILRRFKSVRGTNVSLSLSGEVAALATTERADFLPYHALSVALRRQRKKYRRYFVVLALFSIKEKLYVCAVRWFEILQMFKSVVGTP